MAHVGSVHKRSWLSEIDTVRWSVTMLVAATWLSGALFGLYILLFFGGTALTGAVDRWNESLLGLHASARPWATVAIGAHFVTGGALLLLGPIQLIRRVRETFPTVHRWLGRFYLVAAGVAGLGGVGFILASGTIGGTLMDIGFGLYGFLMMTSAALAYWHAREKRFGMHRAWAIRLFALTVGAWLYRMEYGFWFLAVGRTGHTSTFTGWFDAVMMFFFYIPNLGVAELFIRSRRGKSGFAVQIVATLVLFASSAFVAVATWAFTRDYWAPGMVSGVTGDPL